MTELSETIKKGRNLAIFIIYSSLSLTVLAGIIRIIDFEMRGFISFIIRLGLTVLLCIYFYKGYNAARLIMIILFAIAGTFGIISGSSLIDRTWVGVWLLLLGILYIIYVALLLSLNSIKLFMKYQRENWNISKSY